MARVWFIRHAESEANAGRATLDSAKVGLTGLGHRQAEMVARSFRTVPSLIIASSYERARQTALPTLLRFPDVPYAEWPVHEFTYLPDSYQASTRRGRRPLVEAYWERNDPNYVAGKGAESYYQFLTRVSKVFEYLDGVDDEESVAIFSHGQFIRAVDWTIQHGSLPFNMKEFQYFMRTVPKNGKIWEIPCWEKNRIYSVEQPPSRPFVLTSCQSWQDAPGDLVPA